MTGAQVSEDGRDYWSNYMNNLTAQFIELPPKYFPIGFINGAQQDNSNRLGLA